MTMRGLDAGATGLLAASDHIAVIGNNLANTTTAGFKRSEVRFADLLYEVQDLPGRPGTPETALGVSFGRGTAVSATPTDFRLGPLVTGLPLDLFISGEGFFRVIDAAGEVFYTRLGAFQPKADGAAGSLNLQLSRGPVLLDPPIVLPGVPGTAVVLPTGEVLQGDTLVGRIQLVRFVNLDGLLQVGDLLFEATPDAGPEIVGFPGDPGFGETIDTALEGSNVDIANELVDLIRASQAFNLSAQAVQAGNEEIVDLLAIIR